MPESNHIRTGSLNQINGPAAAPRFDGPRSPPNTSHVPCKFFRQGACQAGTACPFSHDIGSSAETICKYFAKGNCKFGPKCANVHILPDGRRINYSKNGVTIGTSSPINLAGRPNRASLSPSASSVQQQQSSSTSALTNSLYRNDPSLSPYDEQQPQPPRRLSHHVRQTSLDNNGIPTIDIPYSNSTYGSPRDEDRFGFGMSPVNSKGLSVLDAPLPASFDSNGISNAARFPAAPWPSSVPSKFGLESPTPSLSNAKDSRTSETLKMLHTSAFGSSDYIGPSITGSPPTHLNNGDEYFGRRAMHSARFAKPKMLSSSMPKTTSVDRDWESAFTFDDDAGDNVPENYVPENLQDLLTPAEKARRGSMRADDESPGFTKYGGSPIGTSPSRWGPLFQRQREEEENNMRASRGTASAFGHVGSPLRNSTLAQEMAAGSSSHSMDGRLPMPRSASEGMSVLSQQLQKSRLDDAPPTGQTQSPHLHPTSARTPSAIGNRERMMERHLSSGSVGSSATGRFTTPIIDEEDPDFLFSMEDEDDAAAGGALARTRKRLSGGGLGLGMGNYATAAKGLAKDVPIPTANGR